MQTQVNYLLGTGRIKKNGSMDGYDIATEINRLLKKAPYGKLDLSFISQSGNIIEAEVIITNKILVKKGENALIALSAQVVSILEEEVNGKFSVEFCFKNKKVYKLIIKYNKTLQE
tara:strand:- start:368 stop:715 length:348 start_codon:yes stop_codon:yes gene_type:complete